MKAYAAYYPNAVRENASSGGVFSVLASRYEVVYGVAMTQDCRGAEMIRTEGDITPLLGSKYFQAKMGDAYRKVCKDLEDGRQVLFSGTGCQVNGLKMFLQKEYSNLVTVDVVCHGVPSPKLWEDYVNFQEGKVGEKLKSVSFRSKDLGWIGFGMKENGRFFSKDTDPFMQMFLRDYCLRPSCYCCHAKSLKMSDITIADFWGIEEAAPEMHDDRGTSLVIVRTEKGRALFEEVKQELKWKEVSYEEGIRCNPAEYRSPKRPRERDTFFEDLSSVPFSQMCKKYAAPQKVPVTFRIKRKIRNILKKAGLGQA